MNFTFKCHKLPVLMQIGTGGRVEVNNFGIRKIYEPGLHILTDLKTGIVEFTALAEKGLQCNRFFGLPKGPQTEYDKPHYAFYYTAEYETEETGTAKMLELLIEFGPKPATAKPPAGNILGIPADSDGDGVVDSKDKCPNDPNCQ